MITIEELREQYNGLVYFDEDLNPRGEIDWEIIQSRPEYMMQMIADMSLVNKLNTIGREKNWRLGHPYSQFKANLFKQNIIANPDANEFGETAWGSNFKDEEEFQLYSSFYEELFETEVIDDNN